jgi:competence protein ComEA
MLGFTLCALAGSVALAATAHALDINTASLEQLRAVRGIGPKTAQFILEERQRAGPFASFDDLSDRVKGIGPKKAASLQASGLTLGTDGPRQAGKTGPGTRP